MKLLPLILICLMSIPLFLSAGDFSLDTKIKKGYGCPGGKCPGTIYDKIKRREEARQLGLPLPSLTFCHPRGRCHIPDAEECGCCLPYTKENLDKWTKLQKEQGVLCTSCTKDGGVSCRLYRTPREAEIGGVSPRVLQLYDCSES